MALVDQPEQQAWAADHLRQTTTDAVWCDRHTTRGPERHDDRRAVLPTIAAGRRQAALVADSLGHAPPASPGAVASEPRTAEQEQDEIDQEVRRSIVRQRVPGLADLIDELADRHRHWRAVLLEGQRYCDHLAVAVADRRRSAIQRAAEVRARRDELHRPPAADTGDRGRNDHA